jgi:hypothetical protein
MMVGNDKRECGARASRLATRDVIIVQSSEILYKMYDMIDLVVNSQSKFQSVNEGLVLPERRALVHVVLDSFQDQVLSAKTESTRQSADRR